MIRDRGLRIAEFGHCGPSSGCWMLPAGLEVQVEKSPPGKLVRPASGWIAGPAGSKGLERRLAAGESPSRRSSPRSVRGGIPRNVVSFLSDFERALCLRDESHLSLRGLLRLSERSWEEGPLSEGFRAGHPGCDWILQVGGGDYDRARGVLQGPAQFIGRQQPAGAAARVRRTGALRQPGLEGLPGRSREARSLRRRPAAHDAHHRDVQRGRLAREPRASWIPSAIASLTKDV